MDTMIGSFKQSQQDHEYVEQLQNYLLQNDLSDTVTKKKRMAS